MAVWDSELISEIVTAITPELSQSRREVVMQLAFPRGKVIDGIDFSGPSDVFAPRLVHDLIAFGEILPGLPAIIHLLDTLKHRIGVDRQIQFASLIARLRQRTPSVPDQQPAKEKYDIDSLPVAELVAHQQEERPTDNIHTFIGGDIASANLSLESVMRDPGTPASEVVGVFDRVNFDRWDRTRYKQVLHRLKLFFASREGEGGKALLAEIQRRRWPEGLIAAECFDYFDDANVRMDMANQLMEALPRSSGLLLDRPDVVRFAITGLGYLGIVDWRHKILDVLRESKPDLDQKFRSYSLTAAGLLIQKARKEELPYMQTFLQSLLYTALPRESSAPDRTRWNLGNYIGELIDI